MALNVRERRRGMEGIFLVLPYLIWASKSKTKIAAFFQVTEIIFEDIFKIRN